MPRACPVHPVCLSWSVSRLPRALKSAVPAEGSARGHRTGRGRRTRDGDAGLAMRNGDHPTRPSVVKTELMIFDRSVHLVVTVASLLTCYVKPSMRPSDGRLTYGGGSHRKLTCFIAGGDHDSCA